MLTLTGSPVRITSLSIVTADLAVHIFRNSTVAGANFGAFLTGFMFYVNLYYVGIGKIPDGSDSLAEVPSCPSSIKSSGATPRCNPASTYYPSSSHRPLLRSLLDFSSPRPVIIGSTSGLGLRSGRWARVFCRQSRPISLRQSLWGIRFSAGSGQAKRSRLRSWLFRQRSSETRWRSPRGRGTS